MERLLFSGMGYLMRIYLNVQEKRKARICEGAWVRGRVGEREDTRTRRQALGYVWIAEER